MCEVVTIFIKRLKEKAKKAIEEAFEEFVLISFVAIGGVLVCGIFVLIVCLFGKLIDVLMCM